MGRDPASCLMIYSALKTGKHRTGKQKLLTPRSLEEAGVFILLPSEVFQSNNNSYSLTSLLEAVHISSLFNYKCT